MYNQLNIELKRRNNSGWIEVYIDGEYVKNVRLKKDIFYKAPINISLEDYENYTFNKNICRGWKKQGYWNKWEKVGDNNE